MQQEAENGVSVSHPVLKAVTSVLATLFTSWADFASFLAAIYTLILIAEWAYKRFVKKQ